MNTTSEMNISDINEIKNILIKITEEILIIKQDMKKMDKSINELTVSVDGLKQRLDGHIDFIDNTYTSLKAPLNFVKNRVEGIMGFEQKKLT